MSTRSFRFYRIRPESVFFAIVTIVVLMLFSSYIIPSLYQISTWGFQLEKPSLLSAVVAFSPVVMYIAVTTWVYALAALFKPVPNTYRQNGVVQTALRGFVFTGLISFVTALLVMRPVQDSSLIHLWLAYCFALATCYAVVAGLLAEFPRKISRN